MLKVRIDAVPVAVVFLVFCLQLWACTLPLAWTAVMAVVLIFLCGSVVSFQHHHNHCPTFHQRYLNETLDLIMGLQSGITAYSWVLHHNIGHHGNFLEQYPGTGNGPVDASAWTRKEVMRTPTAQGLVNSQITKEMATVTTKTSEDCGYVA